MVTIGISAFTKQCSSLLSGLQREGLVITRRGKPVARVTPYPPSPKDLIGCLRDKIQVNGDIVSINVPWESDNVE